MDFKRGKLNEAKTDIPTTDSDRLRREEWTLDAVGNWSAYKVDADGGLADGDYTDAGDLNQSRTHNLANEIYNATAGAAITEQASPQQSQWAEPAYDARGNMTTGPKPGSETVRLHFVFDAWNRLVEVRADDDGDPGDIVATYRYDATGRRIRKLLGTNPAAPTLTLDYYHNNAGQIIEVHKDGDDDHPLGQYVWSPRYVHAPILRWRDENTDGENLETLYYCNDANMNVMALVDTSGAVVERYLYDPYGKVTVCEDDWTPREGNASAYSNEILFTGHRLDPESGLYITLHRHYHPTLGRWMQRDPQGYVDGMGLYEYVRSRPVTSIDSMGKEIYVDGDTKWFKKTAKSMGFPVEVDEKNNGKVSDGRPVKDQNKSAELRKTQDSKPSGDSAEAKKAESQRKVEEAISRMITSDVDIRITVKDEKGTSKVQAVKSQDGKPVVIFVTLYERGQKGDEHGDIVIIDGKVARDTKLRPDVTLGHEFSHVDAMLQRTFEDNKKLVPFKTAEGLQWMEPKEELRAMGLAFNKPEQVTEQDFRRILGAPQLAPISLITEGGSKP